jgi:hypothetical protein
VLEDVAVVHVAPAVCVEANGDLNELVGVHANRVLEPSLVVVDDVIQIIGWAPFELDRGGEVAILDAPLRDLVADRMPSEDLERVEMKMDRVSVSVRLISCQTSY